MVDLVGRTTVGSPQEYPGRPRVWLMGRNSGVELVGELPTLIVKEDKCREGSWPTVDSTPALQQFCVCML